MSAVAYETEAAPRQKEDPRVFGVVSKEDQGKASASRASLLSLVAEGDWSQVSCDRAELSTAQRGGGETPWSYREYAAELAGLMHLPRKEEDPSG